MSLQAKSTAVNEAFILTPEAFLEHWQGHRRLTRKTIEAFPEKEFMTYSLGNMRPFAELVTEFVSMTRPGIIGAATGKWPSFDEGADDQSSTIKSKEDALRIWDEITREINETWSSISPERFEETDKAFGLYEGKVWWLIQYFIDNEIHHRGQGYVYLRSLGIEPPKFWDRS